MKTVIRCIEVLVIIAGAAAGIAGVSAVIAVQKAAEYMKDHIEKII